MMRISNLSVFLIDIREIIQEKSSEAEIYELHNRSRMIKYGSVRENGTRYSIEIVKEIFSLLLYLVLAIVQS